MLLPHRHRAGLLDPLPLRPLPTETTWDGRIAYLDRDGVLNVGSADYINNVDELIVLKGAAAAVGGLRRRGFRICVVTNQSPIERGWWDAERLTSIHDELMRRLLDSDDDALLDLILYSPYTPWQRAHARKGRAGMLEVGRQLIESAEAGDDISPTELLYAETWDSARYAAHEALSVMVGDRDADMEAGISFGVRTLRCDPSIGLESVINQII